MIWLMFGVWCVCFVVLRSNNRSLFSWCAHHNRCRCIHGQCCCCARCRYRCWFSSFDVFAQCWKTMWIFYHLVVTRWPRVFHHGAMWFDGSLDAHWTAGTRCSIKWKHIRQGIQIVSSNLSGIKECNINQQNVDEDVCPQYWPDVCFGDEHQHVDQVQQCIG